MRRDVFGVAATALAAGGMLGVGAAAVAQPINDDCANAIAVGDGVFAGTTIGATNDGRGTCGASETSPDVWYLYTAPIDGLLTVDTCALSAYDTVLGIWSDCPGVGSETTCNDDSCSLQSRVIKIVSAGETVLIRVSGFSGATGDFLLTLNTDPGGGGFSTGVDVTLSDSFAVDNWGSVGGIRGYSIASTTCNLGDEDLGWDGSSNQHPLLAMNAYRLFDGRLEQIGMSWLKNTTVAAAGDLCGLPCSGFGGSVLNAGCSDVYGSSFNGTQTLLGPRSEVNAYTGDFAYPYGLGWSMSGDAKYKRMQIHESDLTQPGALYFIEGQWTAADDAASGNAMNNASYRRVTVGAGFNLNVTDSMVMGSPAINAWHDYGGGVGVPDDSVQIVAADVPGEGRFHVAAKVTDLGGGMYRYDYAVRNLNSHRSGGSFSVPVPPGATVTNVGFHDVDYHSGEVYDNTDWTFTQGSDRVTWSSPAQFNENPNTNALRFATMYNFWFESDAAPDAGQVTIGLFRPGSPASISADVSVPAVPPCPADIDGDGDADVADFFAFVVAFAAGDPAADINGDGTIDVSDFFAFVAAFSVGC